MPVIIKPSDYNKWLAPETDSSILRSLLLPFSVKGMHAHQVSTEINSYRNDRDGLLNPINHV
jgi:putative SOS response-associated peptidase YedK